MQILGLVIIVKQMWGLQKQLLTNTKYTNTHTQTQLHKHNYTNTNKQTQIHKHKYTNTNTQTQIHKHKYASWVYRQSEWKWLKEPERKRSQICTAFDLHGAPGKSLSPSPCPGAKSDQREQLRAAFNIPKKCFFCNWKSGGHFNHWVLVLDNNKILPPAEVF